KYSPALCGIEFRWTGFLPNVGGPQLAYALVDAQIFAGRGIPRKIFGHAVSHQDGPGSLIAISAQRLTNSEQQSFPGVFRELEASPFTGAGVPGFDSIVQTSGSAHNRNCAVLEAVNLVQTARLIA